MTRRVLVLSDPPGSPSGYGGQAPIVLDAARRAGAEPVALAMRLDATPGAELPERRLADGTRCRFVPYDPPPDLIARIVAEEGATAFVVLAELWAARAVQNFDDASRRRTFLWVNVDCPYFPEGRAPWFASFGGIVMSASYGERVFEPVRAAGGRLLVIPHAVRAELAVPADAATVAARRAAHGLADSFVALSVGRNQFRKGQPWLLDAWSRFVADLPRGEDEGVRLFLHTEQQPAPFGVSTDPAVAAALAAQRGCDLPALLEKQFGACAHTVEFSDLGAPSAELKHLYGVADAHVTATLGEGFGVPIVEAQACGRPNLAPDHTAIPAAMAPARDAPPPGCAPFGWLVPCSGRILQSDVLEWRPIIDGAAYARALREAWEFRRAGLLNAPEAEARRREWTLREFGWERAVSSWAELLAAAL
ncbi:MAG: hypothetical protein HMLKMBBP_01642 [Planctomycetes bacterium]|nr:hypothetical protein [Planctomycetota bacterium]